MRLGLYSISCVLAATSLLAGNGNKEAGREALEKYLKNSQSQAALMRNVSMEVDINARLPKLNKEGKMHAMRFITQVGKIAYKGVRYIGDTTVKKDVIGRYLTAEVQPQTMDIGINDQNYKFKYKGQYQSEGRDMHVFQLSPRHKAVGLFKGELWIDPKTFLPMRESGTFVKNPSVLIKKVDFVRVYEIHDGLAIPKHMESTVDTRVVGKAELAIDFSNFTSPADEDSVADSEAPAESAANR